MNQITIEQMLNKSQEFDSHKEDYQGKEYTFKMVEGFRLEPTSKLGNFSIPGYELTDNAWSQFYARMGGNVVFPKTSKTLPNDLMTAFRGLYGSEMISIFNKMLGKYNGDTFIRTYKNEVRAFLSRTYKPFDNTQLLEIVNRAVPIVEQSTGQKIEMSDRFCSISPDAVHARITIANIDTGDGGSGYGVGVYIGNNEVGNGRLRVVPGIQRWSCQNSMIFSWEEAVNATHRGFNMLKDVDIAMTILKAFQVAQENLALLMDSKQIEIPNIEQEINLFAKARGWSITKTQSVIRGTELENNLFGLVNGLTYAAHRHETTEDGRVAMEELAGNILVSPEEFFKTAWAESAAAQRDQVDANTVVPVYVNR
jgi:hypothetical protein